MNISRGVKWERLEEMEREWGRNWNGPQMVAITIEGLIDSDRGSEGSPFPPPFWISGVQYREGSMPYVSIK